MKPFFLKDVYAQMKAVIDENLDLVAGDKQIPNSISPVDYAIAEARRTIRAKGWVVLNFSVKLIYNFLFFKLRSDEN